MESLMAAVKARDRETFDHSMKVSTYSLALAFAAGLFCTDCEDVWAAALLHDVGKIALPDSILLNPGILTLAQRRAMQTHVDVGHTLLASSDELRPVAEIVRCHHERWDGTGYQRGLRGRLRGTEIPVGARIIAIADAFDAMTSNRPYRPAMSMHS